MTIESILDCHLPTGKPALPLVSCPLDDDSFELAQVVGTLISAATSEAFLVLDYNGI